MLCLTNLHGEVKLLKNLSCLSMAPLYVNASETVSVKLNTFSEFSISFRMTDIHLEMMEIMEKFRKKTDEFRA